MKSYIHLYRTNSEFTEVYNGPDYDEPWLSLTEENMDVNYNKTPPEPPKELTAITFGTITWVTDVPATGGTATKDNCTYTIIARYIGSRPEDITSQVDDVTGELAVEETTIEQRHEAGQLTLSASYCGFTATGNVTVYQEAAEHIPVVTSITISNIECAVDAPAMGGTVYATDCTFEAYANYDDGTSVDISSDVTVEGELVVTPSKEGQRHEAGTMTVTVSYGDVSASTTVTVYQEAFDYSMEPLTFIVSSPGTINWMTTDTALTKTIDYKLNDGEWTSITSNTGASVPTINVVEGDEIQFRGNNAQYSDGNKYNMFSGSTAGFEAEGNIMSLVDSTDFVTATTLQSANTFTNLFNKCTGLTSAENLVLPATTLAYYCYQNMFDGCLSLTTAPELPATTLANYCYWYMFRNCSSLTTTPELPATALTNYCYNGMFQNCTSLTSAPELPATTLAERCYNGMFQGCTSLTTTPELPATTLAQSCYSGMFNGCSSLTTAPELPATALTNYCYYSMFDGCRSLTTAPELPATTLAERCYGSMFQNCTSLTTVPELPATALTSNCYQSMFYGCSSLTTAPELPATTLAKGCYVDMFRECTSLTTTPELPATTLANGCYSGMFNGCSSLTTAPELPATTLAERCYNGMFYGCSSLTTVPSDYLPATTLANYCYYQMFYNCSSLTSAPELPATTLATGCYSGMFNGCSSLTTAPELPATTLSYGCYNRIFNGCSSLNYIKCLATDITATNCTTDWVYNVASTGTFVKNPNMSDWTTGTNGIPTNWTVQDAS